MAADWHPDLWLHGRHVPKLQHARLLCGLLGLCRLWLGLAGGLLRLVRHSRCGWRRWRFCDGAALLMLVRSCWQWEACQGLRRGWNSLRCVHPDLRQCVLQLRLHLGLWLGPLLLSLHCSRLRLCLCVCLQLRQRLGLRGLWPGSCWLRAAWSSSGSRDWHGGALLCRLLLRELLWPLSARLCRAVL